MQVNVAIYKRSHQGGHTQQEAPGLDGRLVIMARRWICQGVSRLHFKLHFGVSILIPVSSNCYPCFYYLMCANIKWLKGGGKSQGNLGLSLRVNLVKRDLQAFNGHSFIIFTVSLIMHTTCILFIATSIQWTGIKV